MKKVIKIGSIIVALLLIGGVVFFANGLLGNPISKFIVDKNSEAYIEENYGELDLTREVGFNFKSTNYFVRVNSETVEDLHFTLYYSMTGKLQRDTYESNIIEGGNIVYRVNMDYRKDTDIIFEKLKNTPFFSSAETYQTSAYILTKEEFENRISATNMNEDATIRPAISGGVDGRTLELDKDYEAGELGKLGGILDVSIRFTDKDESFERGAEALKEVKKAFDEEDYGFRFIDFCIYNEEGNYAYYIDLIPYDEIEGDDLAQRLEHIYENTPKVEK